MVFMSKKYYIPVSEIWKKTFTLPEFREIWTIEDRVPISKIRIDKRLFAWQNEVDLSQVEFIVENFNLDFWMPIMVNPDYFLLDGQHRLKVAERLGLEYIDTVIKIV